MPHDDGACPPEPPDHVGVGGRRGPGEGLRTVGRGQVRNVEQLLDRDRHAVQVRPPPAALELGVRRRGARAAAVSVDRHERERSPSTAAIRARTPCSSAGGLSSPKGSPAKGRRSQPVIAATGT
jgi:hypothetical protein